MEFIFNELSLSKIPRTPREADQWLKAFFDCAVEVSKRRRVSVFILCSVPFSQIMISPVYPFSLWLSEVVDIEYMRLVRSMISKKPAIQNYPYYYYRGKEAKGLGISHYQNIIALSYPGNFWSHTLRLRKEFFDENEDVQFSHAVIRNISNLNHVDIYFPQRIFEHHLKHDNSRHNLEDGESTLQYKIPKEFPVVQKLLDTAVGKVNSTSDKLYNFDTNKGLYIEFQHHLNNRYHGYHIVDETRVPYYIRRKIKV